MVTLFHGLGARLTAPLPASFGMIRMVAWPTSLKIVGTRTVSPSTCCSTSVCTSDSRNPPMVPGSAPDAASIESMTTMHGRPVLPHDVAARDRSRQQRDGRDSR